MKRLFAGLLFQSCSCWRPGSLRGQTIQGCLRHRGRFSLVHDEASGAGVAQSGTAGPYPDQFPPGGPAVSVEDEHRDYCVLGGGKKLAETIRCRTTKVGGTRIGQGITAARTIPIQARRNYIPVAFVPRQNPFYCALPYNDVEHGQFKPEAPLVIPSFKQSYSGPGQSVCRHRWIAFAKGTASATRSGKIAGHFARIIFNMFSETNGRNRMSITAPDWMFPPPSAIIWG